MERPKQRVYIELLEGCRTGLTAYIRHMLWDKSALEGALQDTMLTGWQKFDSFRGNADAFRAWIFQIATYTVFNLNRAGVKTRERESKNAFDTESVQDKTTGPKVTWNPANPKDYERFLEQSGQMLNSMESRVKESVIGLPENERRVFLLRSLGELAYNEISKILDIPIGSVMGYLARARVKLREELYDYFKKD